MLRQRALEAQKAREQEARAREQESRRQASEERLEIARELHDVLAHSISADQRCRPTSRWRSWTAAPSRPGSRCRRSRTPAARRWARSRSVLTVLRGDRAAPRDPAPDLGRLGHLMELAGAAGLKVALSVVGDVEPGAAGGEPGRVPDRPGVADQRGPRTPPPRARPSWSSAADGLHLRIADDGRGARSASSGGGGGGNGLPGMRERATALRRHADGRPAGRRRLPGRRARSPTPLSGRR